MLTMSKSKYGFSYQNSYWYPLTISIVICVQFYFLIHHTPRLEQMELEVSITLQCLHVHTHDIVHGNLHTFVLLFLTLDQTTCCRPRLPMLPVHALYLVLVGVLSACGYCTSAAVFLVHRFHISSFRSTNMLHMSHNISFVSNAVFRLQTLFRSLNVPNASNTLISACSTKLN